MTKDFPSYSSMKYSVLGVEYLLEKINTGILSHGFDEYILFYQALL